MWISHYSQSYDFSTLQTCLPTFFNFHVFSLLLTHCSYIIEQFCKGTLQMFCIQILQICVKISPSTLCDFSKYSYVVYYRKSCVEMNVLGLYIELFEKFWFCFYRHLSALFKSWILYFNEICILRKLFLHKYKADFTEINCTF